MAETIEAELAGQSASISREKAFAESAAFRQTVHFVRIVERIGWLCEKSGMELNTTRNCLLLWQQAKFPK
ncbi:hypothetical protein PF049_00705 [Erythrobacteraceae bacterium WH01K]|nr:hypothetical protein PF049_00705 [Erythrobacteraceae bacterium WH01K]